MQARDAVLDQGFLTAPQDALRVCLCVCVVPTPVSNGLTYFAFFFQFFNFRAGGASSPSSLAPTKTLFNFYHCKLGKKHANTTPKINWLPAPYGCVVFTGNIFCFGLPGD